MQRQNKGNNPNTGGTPAKDNDQKKENAPKPVMRPLGTPSLLQYDRRIIFRSRSPVILGTKRIELC